MISAGVSACVLQLSSVVSTGVCLGFCWGLQCRVSIPKRSYMTYRWHAALCLVASGHLCRNVRLCPTCVCPGTMGFLCRVSNPKCRCMTCRRCAALCIVVPGHLCGGVRLCYTCVCPGTMGFLCRVSNPKCRSVTCRRRAALCLVVPGHLCWGVRLPDCVPAEQHPSAQDPESCSCTLHAQQHAQGSPQVSAPDSRACAKATKKSESFLFLSFKD